MTQPAIETLGLTKDYGSDHGVFGLDLEIRAGEIFGFLGPNGSGKTTSMRMLVGLSRPTSGGARVLGLDIVADSLAIRRRVGFLAGATSASTGGSPVRRCSNTSPASTAASTPPGSAR